MTPRLCAALFICVVATSPTLARTVYVDISNTSDNQDGVSWATAFTKLQDAIDAANASTQDEIWVADGVYVERRLDPDGSLVLKASVPLYGGFASGETQRSQRDWIANPAVIDGLDQRNGLNPEAVHVIKGAEDATLDGFIVRNGDGFGASTFPKDRGGAIFANGVSMNIVRCRFERNKSRFGGAIYFNVSQSTITDCVFEESLVDGFGGAIFINSDSTLLIENCVFRSNIANKGGAIYIASPGNDATIRACQFIENTALSDGGAGIFVDNASALIESCRFFDNFSEGGGAAIFNFAQSSPDIINCIFAGNESRVLGGAIHNLNNAHPRIVNCTITENTAGQQGGAISNEGGSAPMVVNSVLWSNSPDQITDRDSSVSAASFSIIQGGFAGDGNIDADPLFVDPANRNFHLLGDSPGISAGTLDGAPNHDIDGVPRPQGPAPDIGAFEQGPDFDFDGIPDFIEGQDDPDGDTIPNFQDDDSDGDSITDLEEGAIDSDSDGIPDYLDLDSDDDGITDASESTNGLNQRDPSDAAADRDGDGVSNIDEINVHTTRIDDADTDNDLMNDGYEVRSALDPLFNDAALDPDNDGLENLLESLIDTYPFDPNDPVDDVFVATTGNDATGTGLNANPWKTISFAIESVASVAADFHP
ncbi:MAG: choice-of-anchor Q domain-containing protein, partial [Candidatus Hydrogenedentota bacterium]